MPDVSPTQKTTAAIYFPVSASDEDQKKQLIELLRHALVKEWRVVEYRERPARAKTRPIFNQMMEDAKRRKFEVILVYSLDCFARSLIELSATVTSLQPFKIRFVSFRESIDIDQDTWDGCKFLFTLKVLVDAERSMKIRNVRAGIARAQSMGIRCGRPRRRFAGAEARKLRKQGLSIRAIAARIGVPASTIADALRIEEDTEPRSSE